jgi:hypothetical protein
MHEQPVISGEAEERDDEEEQGTGGDASPSHCRQGMTPTKLFLFYFVIIYSSGFLSWGSFKYTLVAADFQRLSPRWRARFKTMT